MLQEHLRNKLYYVMDKMFVDIQGIDLFLGTNERVGLGRVSDDVAGKNATRPTIIVSIINRAVSKGTIRILLQCLVETLEDGDNRRSVLVDILRESLPERGGRPDLAESFLTSKSSAASKERLLATRYFPLEPHQTLAYFCGDRLSDGGDHDRAIVNDLDEWPELSSDVTPHDLSPGPRYTPVIFERRGGFGGTERRTAEAFVKAALHSEVPTNLIAFVAPFAADVRETLLGLGVCSIEGNRYDKVFAFRNTYWCDAASILLFAPDDEKNPLEALAFGIACDPSDTQLVADITSVMSDWTDVLILVDLSEIDIESLVGNDRAKRMITHLFALLRQLLGISVRRGKATIVLGVPKCFQAAGLGADQLAELWPDAVYEAVAPGLSDAALRHGHRPFIEPENAFQTRNLRQLLTPFRNFNSNVLRQSVEKFLNSQPPNTLNRCRRDEVLAAAAHFLSDGFLEVAYRLELFCRSDAHVEPPIIRSAVMPEKARSKIKSVSAGYVSDARLLPMIHSRFFLFGPSGTSKTEVLLQIERAYAVPSFERLGKLHSYWLPMLFSPSEFERLNVSDMLSSRGSIVPPNSPTNPLLLTAHLRLARFAKLGDVENFLASPLLLLVDDGQDFPWSEEHTSRQLTFLQKFALILAWDEQTARDDLDEVVALPFASGAGAAELEGLRFADAMALFATHGGKADLTRFQFSIDQPIHAMLSRPFLVECLADLDPAILESGERLTRFGVLKAFVDGKSRAGPPEDFQILVENTLPKAAYERRIGSDRGIVNQQDMRLARRAKLIKVDRGPVAFGDSLLYDYFVALEMRKRLRHGGDAEHDDVFNAIFSRTSPEKWPALYGDLIRLLCGALESRSLSHLMRYLDAHGNQQLAHDGLLELDVAAYGAVPESGRIAGTLAEVAADPKSASAPQAALALSYYDPRIAAPSEFLASLCRIGDYEAMAPHPVTNLEFCRFVSDGGYNRSVHWLDGGWLWKEKNLVNGPAFWSSSDYSHPNQPVVGVSFYEAKAYCNWLSARLGQGAGSRIGLDLPRVLDWDRASGALWQLPQLVQWAESVLSSAESDHDRKLAELTPVESGILGRRPTKPTAALRAPPLIGMEQPNELGLFGMQGSVWTWCNEQQGGGKIEDTLLGTGSTTDRVTAVVKGGYANAVDPLLGGGLDLTARLPMVGLRIVAVAKDGEWGSWG